jgi:hypothetical protein
VLEVIQESGKDVDLDPYLVGLVSPRSVVSPLLSERFEESLELLRLLASHDVSFRAWCELLGPLEGTGKVGEGR